MSERKITIRPATQADLDTALQLRMEVLRDVHDLPPDADMSHMREPNRLYFMRELGTAENQLTLLAFDGQEPVGCASICYYSAMPCGHSLAGKEAIIMNVYMRETHRGLGVAGRMIEMLLADARQRGDVRVMLDASDKGRPLYEKHGFVTSPDMMVLVEYLD